MTRREALTALAALFAAAATTGSRRLLATVPTNTAFIRSGELPLSMVELINEFGETILPKTPSSGGAKEAQVGEFLAEVFRDFSGRLCGFKATFAAFRGFPAALLAPRINVTPFSCPLFGVGKL